MPRLFDRYTHRHTYAVLVSLCMSGIMSFTLGFIRLGFSWETAKLCLLSWPLAFFINIGAIQVVSPAMRALTVWLWRRRS